MVDPNRRDFLGRVGRINRAHESGAGFEAEGALGMSYYNSLRRRRRRPRALGILIVSAVVFFGLKAGMHVALGPDSYDYRVAAMRTGGDVDRVGAWLLQSDPVTIGVADWIRRIIN